MKKQLLTALLLTMGLAFPAISALATTTTVTEFQTLPGDKSAYPSDVNLDFEMVGISSNNSGDKAVLWRDPASPPELLTPSASVPPGSSVAMAIDDDGTIIGNQLYFTSTANYVAVVWNRNADDSYGAAEVLPLPAGYKNGHAEEISGDIIAGSASVIGQFGAVPIFWEWDGTSWNFEPLQKQAGAFSCNANDVNAQGVIVGLCGATAVRWNPTAGVYGAPTALTGSSGNAFAINDGNVVVGSASGNPAKWSSSGSLSFPFGSLGGNAVDVNNDSWILARKSSGSVLYYSNGTTTTNLSTLLAGKISGFTSGGFGGALTNKDSGIVLIAVGANVTRTGYRGNVPVLIEVDTNH